MILLVIWGFSLIEQRQYQDFLTRISKDAQLFQISFSRLIESKYVLEEGFYQEIESAKSQLIEDYRHHRPLNHYRPQVMWVADHQGRLLYTDSRIRSDQISEIGAAVMEAVDQDHGDFTWFPGYLRTDSALFFIQAESRQNLIFGLGLQVPAPEMMESITHINRFMEDYFQFSSFIYVGWQNDDGIMAASPAFLSLSRIAGDPFLQNVTRIKSRQTTYQDRIIAEIVLPLVISRNPQGILRIGFSLQQYRQDVINFRWRSISALLLISGVLLVGYGYTWHRNRIRILNQEYYNLSNYTGLILQSIDDSVVVMDTRRRLVYSNTAFLKLVGLPESDRIEAGHTIDRYLPLPAILSNPSGDLEFVNLNHEKKSIDYQLKDFTDSHGNTQRIILIRDMSRFRELEQRNRRTERMSLLGKMSSMVAHEIRNPLNTVHMIIQRLGMEFSVTEKKEDYLHFIALVQQEVRRINQIVTRFLEYGRLPSPIKQWVDLGDILVDMHQMVEIWRQEKDFQFDMDRVSLMMNLDRNQILQVLINLLKNAFQALPESGGRIELRITRKPAEMVMTIRDNGFGIPPDRIDKVFEMYFTTKSDGSGFGLPISKKIIEEHGGRIELDSRENEGTEVRINLPIEPPPPQGPVVPDEADPLVGTKS